MNDIKVSIIIPVYNTEKYLKQCLESVTRQTLHEIEIICVNDGSMDSSPDILEEYSQKDQRLKVINKTHDGPGSARNKGIEHAVGEYIGFVDSDDWIELDMYEKLYKNAKTHGSDIVMCPIHIFDENDQKLKYDNYHYTFGCFDKNYYNISFNHSQIRSFIFAICVTAWNKIYKTEYLKKIKVRFPENLIFEDLPFFYETFLNAMYVSVLNEYLYFYRINRLDSIINTKGKHFFDLIKINNLIKNVFINTGNFENYKMDLLKFIIDNTVYRFLEVDELYKQEFYELIKQDFKNMKLSSAEIDDLNSDSQNKYLNIIKCNYYREFELLEEICGLKNELKSYEEQLQELKSSNSWKLTRPLRIIGTVFKKIKNSNYLIKHYWTTIRNQVNN